MTVEREREEERGLLAACACASRAGVVRRAEMGESHWLERERRERVGEGKGSCQCDEEGGGGGESRLAVSGRRDEGVGSGSVQVLWGEVLPHSQQLGGVEKNKLLLDSSSLFLDFSEPQTASLFSLSLSLRFITCQNDPLLHLLTTTYSPSPPPP